VVMRVRVVVRVARVCVARVCVLRVCVLRVCVSIALRTAILCVAVAMRVAIVRVLVVVGLGHIAAPRGNRPRDHHSVDDLEVPG
jgi:hypothetical protein